MQTTAQKLRSSGAFVTKKAKRRYFLILSILAIVSVLIIAGNLAWDNPMPLGSKGFWRIAELRATNVTVMLVVAFCQAVATIAFQTVTNNRIITPSIMGFESLYRLIQTSSVFFLGEIGLTLVQGVWQFILQVILMVAMAGVLYGWLLSDRFYNMQIMLLVGIIIGGGLGALASFMQRMLTPTEFDLLTARLIGSMANADASYLSISIPLVVTVGAALWINSAKLNVIALGRQSTINLGLNHTKQTITALLLVSVLMAISTSLIGPMTFFGFLVAMITYQIADTYDHRYLFPMGWLIGFVTLGGAYFILRNIFYAEGSIGIIIEIVGGGLFLLHILRKGRL